MPVRKYFVVHTPSKTILAGPFNWDNVKDPGWTPPVAGSLMLVQDAVSGGYKPAVVAPDPAETIRGKLVAGQAANAAFQALASPSAVQVAAQVKALTAQVNGLIRLALQATDNADDV